MNKVQEKSDAQLVKLSLEDPKYFGQLVERYEKKLLRYIRRLSGLEIESAEDILQEAFIKVYVNLNEYDSDFTFSSWIYRITHNETINHLRKYSKADIIPLETDDETGNLIEILKSEINIEDETNKKDIVEKIRVAISMLPQKYREVLILRYIEDMDYKEISDILKMPMGTVATTINRAKEKFKQIAEKLHLNPQEND
jgi:RNA polymerase sigma-70 factor (ECF subfamily)